MYSTYLGGSAVESVELGGSIAVDASNSAYVTGTTSSSNFPVLAALQASSRGGGNDAFVVKLTAAGTAFVYSTYLGGSSMDFGESVAVDSGGSAYIGGYTASPDFPIASAGQPAIGGNYDAFVAKLNPSGSVLTESGFLGGGGADAGYGVAIDSSGNAYLAGQTFSTDFPLLGAVQTTLGSTLAAFVARFSFGPAGPPTAVSATPSGTGASQTFALVYSDSRGFADISWVEMNWSATQATAGACYLHYDRATNVLQLSNDAGSGWVGSVTLGAPGTMQNSQCIVDAGASSASGSGNNLTVNLALTFKPAFAGAKNIYMRVQDAANTLTFLAGAGNLDRRRRAARQRFGDAGVGLGHHPDFQLSLQRSVRERGYQYVNILFQTTLEGASCLLSAVHAVDQYAGAGGRFRQRIRGLGRARIPRHAVEQPVLDKRRQFLRIGCREQPDGEPGGDLHGDIRREQDHFHGAGQQCERIRRLADDGGLDCSVGRNPPGG